MIAALSASSPNIHARINRAPAEAPAPAPTNAPPQQTPPPPQSGESQEAAGVLRLLAEGHFKGVADVRLRINFAEQLQAQQAAQQGQAAPQAVAGLTTQITDAFAPYVGQAPAEPAELAAETEGEPPATLQNALDTFAASTASAAETFAADPGANLETLRTSLQEAFSALVTAAQPLVAAALAPPVQPPVEDQGEVALEPPPQEPLSPVQQPVDEQVLVPVEFDPSAPPPEELAETQPPQQPAIETLGDPVEEPDPAAEFFAGVQQSFDTALSELLATLGAVGQLPPLSEPSGNGGAYAKFLAMYQAMQAPPPQDPALAVEG